MCLTSRSRRHVVALPTLQTAIKHSESSFPCPKPAPNSKPIQPKRQRRSQKPGLTAKNNERHFVVHNYHDHALDTGCADSETQHSGKTKGPGFTFPMKLHTVLDQVEADGLGHIIAWQPHGRCFLIRERDQFVDTIMPKYFRQTKLSSFQRQLNLYGFNRLTCGPDAGGYYSELFLRGRPSLCKQITRTKVKGTRFKAASSPEQEPDFYNMAPVLPLSDEPPVSSSDKLSSKATAGDFQDTTCKDQEHWKLSDLPTTDTTVPKDRVCNETDIVDPSISELFLGDTPTTAAGSAGMVSEDRSMSKEAAVADETDTVVVDPSLYDFCSFWCDDDYFVSSALKNDIQLNVMLECLLQE